MGSPEIAGQALGAVEQAAPHTVDLDLEQEPGTVYLL
jgi:hypothetical protein